MISCVVSRYKKNVDWVYQFQHVKDVFIYDKETPENPYNVPVNKGQEASAYLKYIIDHYDHLAAFTFFTHDDEFCWHHSGSIKDKYAEAIQEINNGKLYYNINDRCVLGSIVSNPWYDDILRWYDQYIEKYIPMASLPDKDWTEGHRGSAQFVVHKSLILKLPKQFYQDLYDWITTTDMTSDKTSRFMEWVWHVFWVIYPQTH